MKFFNPKSFLKIGGWTLILLAVLGFIGITGPTPSQSIFGSYWWFDNAENWTHLVLGIIAVAGAYSLSESLQRPLVSVVGIVGILVGLYGFMFSSMLLGASLENPSDNLLHVIVGGWAVWSAYAAKYSLWARCQKGDMEACNMLDMHRVSR